MSFTSKVKSEIIRAGFFEDEHKVYLLHGLLSSTLKINDTKPELIVKNNAINNYINMLFYEIYGNSIDKLDIETIGELFRNFEEQQYMIPNIKLSDKNLLRYFLVGIYLGCGSLIDPETSYHLEMKTGSEKLSYFAISILDKFGISAKISVRNRVFFVYINDAEGISDFLKLCGTTQALLQFEELRVVKDVRNSINRKVNCELANMNKVIETGLKQQNDIVLVKERVGLHSLPQKLYDVAVIRLENEQLSFLEIGEMLSPKVSKSTVCKRLKKISELAEELRGV